jgi:transcriptional regulator with XRE-family HTH domain
MRKNSIDTYIRTHRKKAGLTQSEVGKLLGYSDNDATARHETAQSLPPLVIALGYEVIFKVPISKLFPGLKETAEKTVELRIERFERCLQKRQKDHRLPKVGQKLAWLLERRDSDDE